MEFRPRIRRQIPKQRLFPSELRVSLQMIRRLHLQSASMTQRGFKRHLARAVRIRDLVLYSSGSTIRRLPRHIAARR